MTGGLHKNFDFSKISKVKPMKIRDLLDKDGGFEFLSLEEYTIIDKPTNK